jgi:hypothetical protein
MWRAYKDRKIRKMGLFMKNWMMKAMTKRNGGKYSSEIKGIIDGYESTKHIAGM